MEYRAFLEIPGLLFAHEAKWEPLIDRLEREYGSIGPVIGFTEDATEIVVSMASGGEADAARRAVDAVTDCLRAVGLGDLYPASVEVEPVPAEELASA